MKGLIKLSQPMFLKETLANLALLSLNPPIALRVKPNTVINFKNKGIVVFQRPKVFL